MSFRPKPTGALPDGYTVSECHSTREAMHFATYMPAVINANDGITVECESNGRVAATTCDVRVRASQPRERRIELPIEQAQVKSVRVEAKVEAKPRAKPKPKVTAPVIVAAPAVASAPLVSTPPVTAPRVVSNKAKVMTFADMIRAANPPVVAAEAELAAKETRNELSWDAISTMAVGSVLYFRATKRAAAIQATITGVRDGAPVLQCDSRQPLLLTQAKYDSGIAKGTSFCGASDKV